MKIISHLTTSSKNIQEEALYTCDEDFLRLFSDPLIRDSFVDFGCGTGKGCLLYGMLFPERKALRGEWENARLHVGPSFQDNFNISNVEFKKQDLLVSPLPFGDTYFLYYPKRPVL